MVYYIYIHTWPTGLTSDLTYLLTYHHVTTYDTIYTPHQSRTDLHRATCYMNNNSVHYQHIQHNTAPCTKPRYALAQHLMHKTTDDSKPRPTIYKYNVSTSVPQWFDLIPRTKPRRHNAFAAAPVATQYSPRITPSTRLPSFERRLTLQDASVDTVRSMS